MDNIFALNNQVFGSKFRERRVSSRTRKRVGSELIIPDSAVEMTYSDMCEVNGGGISTNALACIIDLGLICVCGIINGCLRAAGFFGKGAIKHLILKSAPNWAKTLNSAVKSIAMIQGIGGIVGLIGGALNDVSQWIDKITNLFSIGGIIASILDMTDSGGWDGNISF